MISERITEKWQDDSYRRQVVERRAQVQSQTNDNLRAAWQRNYDERVAGMRTQEHRQTLAASQHRRYEDENELAKLSEAQTRRWSDATARAEQSTKQKAFSLTEDGKRVKSQATAGKIWITNGEVNKRVSSDLVIPSGFRLGRTNNGNLGRQRSN